MSERQRPPRSSEPHDERLTFKALGKYAAFEHFQDFRTAEMPRLPKSAATACFINLAHGLNKAVVSKRRKPWDLSSMVPEVINGKNPLDIGVVRREAVQLPPMNPGYLLVDQLNPYYYDWETAHPVEAQLALGVESLVDWARRVDFDTVLPRIGLGSRTGELFQGFIAAVQAQRQT